MKLLPENETTLLLESLPRVAKLASGSNLIWNDSGPLHCAASLPTHPFTCVCVCVCMSVCVGGCACVYMCVCHECAGNSTFLCPYM